MHANMRDCAGGCPHQKLCVQPGKLAGITGLEKDIAEGNAVQVAAKIPESLRTVMLIDTESNNSCERCEMDVCGIRRGRESGSGCAGSFSSTKPEEA